MHERSRGRRGTLRTRDDVALARSPDSSRCEQPDAAPERDVDLPGGDHDSVKGVTLTSCKEMCIGDAACRAFSYVQNSMVLVE